MHKPYKLPIENSKYQAHNVLEDEFHFILECSLYNDLCAQYIKRYYLVRPNIPFIELLQSENNCVVKAFQLIFSIVFCTHYETFF